MKTATVLGKHLFSFRTQKLSPSRLRVVVSVKRQSTDAVFDFLFFKKSFKCESFDSLMKGISKSDVKKKIDEYFSKKTLKSKETKKIKKFAMSHRISLKEYRKRFCKKCCSDLKFGKIRVSKKNKKVICNDCGFENGWKIK